MNNISKSCVLLIIILLGTDIIYAQNCYTGGEYITRTFDQVTYHPNQRDNNIEERSASCDISFDDNTISIYDLRIGHGNIPLFLRDIPIENDCTINYFNVGQNGETWIYGSIESDKIILYVEQLIWFCEGVTRINNDFIIDL